VTSNLRLPFDEPEPVVPAAESRLEVRDRDGRARAVDPRFNVALEASAGTGKTRVLVDRYINLLRAGVEPANILAITFTRKAAAEMRERILATLRTAAARGELAAGRWRELRDRLGDVTISTIDAFCLSLLREFPLEADLDPGFAMADDTEVPRLVDESLDRALRICRALAREDEHVALVFAQLGDRRARAGLAALLHRRLVAPAVLERYLATGPRDLDVATAATRGATALVDVVAGGRGGLDRFVDSGPMHPKFLLLVRELRRLDRTLQQGETLDPATVQAAFGRAREHFLTHAGTPRSRPAYRREMFASPGDYRTHRELVAGHAPAIASAFAGYRRDLNVLVSRGVWRMYRVAEAEYRRTLDAHAVLDFPDVLRHTLDLLRRMDEFAQSRYRLESRYHHVLVDEFQDTSRAQWELVSLLVQSWGEGAGLAHAGPLAPTIFIVGDRKQSIYRFRDADVSVLQEASRYLEALRPDGDVRRSISRSFRSVPALLSFVNDVCRDVDRVPGRRDAFDYREEDEFPIDAGMAFASDAVGVIVAGTHDGCAAGVADEIARLLGGGDTVRDRDTGVRRPIRPGDIAILFRTRDSHRDYQAALEQRGIPAHVYKGLGFFDADEIKDVVALLWYLADPQSDLRAAAWLRSRFVRLSDEALRRLAPGLADAIVGSHPTSSLPALDADDAEALRAARAGAAAWLALVDRLPPAELLDRILHESAYQVELRGPRYQQARENLKKMRALIRRIQNRGYATLPRIAAHLDRLAVGDEANAAIDAVDAVNLMTVHAAKGLEFPVVFVVNLSRGAGNRRDPIRVHLRQGDGGDVDADGASGGVMVAVGDFRSEADDDAPAKEREETKRLLYVALTRARDRLYLASVLQDGVIVPGRGSLGEVLPPALLACIAGAAVVDGRVRWTSSSGTVHELCVCRGESPPPVVADVRPASEPAAELDVMPIVDLVPAARSVAALTEPGPLRSGDHTGRDSSRLRGTLVHRLVQHVGLGGVHDGAALRARAADLLRPDEVAGVAGIEALVDDAVAAYRELATRADVQAVYESGEAWHELPFVMRVDGHILRGSIDCLIRHDAGSMTVLELKTGQRRPEHDQQAELYRRAVRQIFPDADVHVRVIYLGE
jgi:ATP-dependent helicase/nuclease subunit A